MNDSDEFARPWPCAGPARPGRSTRTAGGPTRNGSSTTTPTQPPATSQQGRSAVLLTLAAEVPAAILAKALGIHVRVAIQWQKIPAGTGRTRSILY